MIRKHFKMIDDCEVIVVIRSGRQRWRWDLSSLRRCWNIRTFYASCWDHKNWYTFFSQHDVFDGKIIVAVSCSHGFEGLCISLLHKKMAVWNSFHILDWGFIVFSHYNIFCWLLMSVSCFRNRNNTVLKVRSKYSFIRNERQEFKTSLKQVLRPWRGLNLWRCNAALTHITHIVHRKKSPFFFFRWASTVTKRWHFKLWLIVTSVNCCIPVYDPQNGSVSYITQRQTIEGKSYFWSQKLQNKKFQQKQWR